MNESLARGVPTLPSARLRRAATSPQGEALNLRSSETVFSPSLFVFPVRQKELSVRSQRGGWEQGVQGGRIRPPAYRRASKASLELERLAEPISRAKHRHAEWRDGAKQGGPHKAPRPPEGEQSEPGARAFGRANKAGRNTGTPNGVTVRSKEGRSRPPAYRRVLRHGNRKIHGTVAHAAGL